MNLLTTVNRDIQQILSTDFAQNIIFTPPLGVPVTVTGYAGKHSINVNELGFITVNSKEARITITEAFLVAKGYITRGSDDNLLSFAGHLVTWTDVSEKTMTYIVQKGKSAPDETVGTISFVLGYYKVGTPPPARIIYGWSDCVVKANIVSVVDPLNVQVLGNGDTIPLEYVRNNDGTITIPYLALYPGINILTPFMLNSRPIQGMLFNPSTGTFNNAAHGGFNIGNKTEFNATLPIFTIPT